MFKIQIPKPCHEDWNAMTPTQQGAFCSSCSKEVVDFTQMTDEEVQNYFLYKTAGKTCGRFRSEQVDRIRITLPENILLQKIAGWKKIMAVVMLAFGSMLFGCDVGTKQNTIGDVEKIQTAPKDTIKVESYQTLGEPAICTDSTVNNSNFVITGITVAEEPPVPEIMGDMIMIPDTTTKQRIDTLDYNNTFTGKILLEKKADTATKKPVSDTTKCPDTGYY